MDPLLLITLGADPLPDTTPVVPVSATWVPAVYVPPSVPVPAGVLASPIADAVLLTWQAVEALAPEYEIERAPDVDGEPGEWLPLARTMDLRYSAAAPDGLAYWFRLRTESLGRLSDYSAPIVGVPIASNPPVIPLAIVDGVVTINCIYSTFKLVLNADVTGVRFVNVPAVATLLIEIEQAAPGGHTLAWPPSVVPVSGVPYAASAAVGAIDIVGLTTNDAGVTWRLVAQQPVASALTVTLAPSPAGATVATDGATAVAPSVQVTATTAGGAAPITHAWTRADTSPGEDYLIDDPASAAPTFSIAAGTTAYSGTQQWRDTVTDANGLQAQATAGISLVRTSTAVELSANDVFEFRATAPGEAITVKGFSTAQANFGTGPYSYAWAKKSGVGTPLTYGAASDTALFSARGSWVHVDCEYTVTATDALGATRQRDVSVVLTIEDGR